MRRIEFRCPRGECVALGRKAGRATAAMQFTAEQSGGSIKKGHGKRSVALP